MTINNGQHIVEIITTTSCTKHAAPENTACWNIYPGSNNDDVYFAVCGARITKRGYNGKVSDSSLATKKFATKKEVRA